MWNSFIPGKGQGSTGPCFSRPRILGLAHSHAGGRVQLVREQGLWEGAGCCLLWFTERDIPDGPLKSHKIIQMAPSPAAPKLVRCWGWEQQGWAAPFSAYSGLLLATGGDTKPPGVTRERERREREVRREGGGSARLPRALGSTRGTSVALAQLCWGRAWLAHRGY